MQNLHYTILIFYYFFYLKLSPKSNHYHLMMLKISKILISLRKKEIYAILSENTQSLSMFLKLFCLRKVSLKKMTIAMD